MNHPGPQRQPVNQIEAQQRHTVRAIREFCYRWTCPKCKNVNRWGIIQVGWMITCDKCDRESKVVSIQYDNGAVMELEKQKE